MLTFDVFDILFDVMFDSTGYWEEWNSARESTDFMAVHRNETNNANTEKWQSILERSRKLLNISINKDHKTFWIYLTINFINLNLPSLYYELLKIKMYHTYYRHPILRRIKLVNNPWKKVVFWQRLHYYLYSYCCTHTHLICQDTLPIKKVNSVSFRRDV